MGLINEYPVRESAEGIAIPGYDRDTLNPVQINAENLGGGGVYDQVIRTQAEFNNLIASPTWLGAQSVALVGEFDADAGIVIPATVKQIHGFNGAKITVTAGGDTEYGLSYAVRPELDKGYEIWNLEVVCTGTAYNYGFYNCTNLTNCTGTGTAVNGCGFSDCTNLTNCTGTGTGTVDIYEGYDGNGDGFYNCTNLTNCTGTGNGNGNGNGFYNCTNLTNCTGTATGNYGSGYGFYNCSYCNGCKSGTTPSTTSIWGGAHLKRDDDSCELD